MKETVTHTWAYETEKGDLITFNESFAIVLESWVDAAQNHKCSIKIFSHKGIEEIFASSSIVIHKLYYDK